MEKIINGLIGKWKVKFLFSKPIIAAFFIGSVIHILQQFNSVFFLKRSYISKLIDEFSISFIALVVHILVPYIIPFIISTFGKYITEFIQKESLMKYPQSNPNIVMKICNSGEVVFINNIGEQYCEKFGIKEEECHKLLPDDYLKIINNLIKTNSDISVYKQYEDHIFDYKFTSFFGEDAVFVSGVDVTHLKRLESIVGNANSKMAEIMLFFDQSVELYKNRTFDIENQNKKMMDLLLKDSADDTADKADYIFLTGRIESTKLAGYIYCKEEGKIKKCPKEILIDSDKDSVAIVKGVDGGTYSNWNDEFTNIEDYQELFHPDVREKVGTVSGFATFHSGDVALIAFYKTKYVNKYDLNILKSIATYSNSLGILLNKSLEVENAFIYTVESLARAAEANDDDTGDHILRVNEYSKILAEAVGMDADFVKTIHFSAQMHDVGKIHIHPDILKKPGKLTDEEFKKMKAHPFFGRKILGNSPKLKMAREIAESHHEKWNGRGYPKGLKGEEIPISGRIVNLVDIYDALRQKRVYKPSFSHQKAYEIITEGDGRVNPTEFDPLLLEAFKNIHEKFDDIFEKFHPNES